MPFEERLDQAIAMLRRRRRVTYQTLKLQFDLDDEHLEGLVQALIEAEQLAIDEAGKVLVWTPRTPAPPTTVTSITIRHTLVPPYHHGPLPMLHLQDQVWGCWPLHGLFT